MADQGLVETGSGWLGERRWQHLPGARRRLVSAAYTGGWVLVTLGLVVLVVYGWFGFIWVMALAIAIPPAVLSVLAARVVDPRIPFGLLAAWCALFCTYAGYVGSYWARPKWSHGGGLDGGELAILAVFGLPHLVAGVLAVVAVWAWRAPSKSSGSSAG